MPREHEIPWRGCILLDDEMNAHWQADELPLPYVMAFNANEREWQSQQDRLRKFFEQIDTALRKVV